jgi:hypothetical protein
MCRSFPRPPDWMKTSANEGSPMFVCSLKTAIFLTASCISNSSVWVASWVVELRLWTSRENGGWTGGKGGTDLIIGESLYEFLNIIHGDNLHTLQSQSFSCRERLICDFETRWWNVGCSVGCRLARRTWSGLAAATAPVVCSLCTHADARGNAQGADRMRTNKWRWNRENAGVRRDF